MTIVFLTFYIISAIATITTTFVVRGAYLKGGTDKKVLPRIGVIALLFAAFIPIINTLVTLTLIACILVSGGEDWDLDDNEFTDFFFRR